MENLRKALEIVQPVSKFIPVAGQYLEPSLKGLMKLLEMAEQAKSNKKALKSLANRASRLSLTIIDRLKDVPKDYHDQEIKPLLEGLLKSINETETYFKERQASTEGKSVFKKAGVYVRNVWSSPEDKEALEKLKRQMDDAIKEFLVLAGLDVLLRLEDIEVQAKRITRWMEDFVVLKQLKTVHTALHTSRDAPDMCAQGTSTLLLDELVTWAAARDVQRIYWLSGLAGTGKSTVARTLCNSIAKSPATNSPFIISFFVSRRHEAERRDPLCMVHTLSFYLARALPNFRAELLSRLETPDLLSRDISVQLDELIVEPLKRCGDDQHRAVVIVIDAFDECNAGDDRQQRKLRDFLRSLLKMVKDSALHVRMLFTSRWMSFIDDAFEEHRQPDASVPFLSEHKIELPSLHADIRIYLAREFQDIAKEKKLNHWPTPKDLDNLVALANGLFIYAATVVRYVRDADDPKKTLTNVMTPGSSPSASSDYGDLDDMYGVVLTNAAPPSVGAVSAQQKAIALQRVLGALSVSQRPLTVGALAKLLGSEMSKLEVDGVVRRLASVLRVECECISFYHATFLDYLVDGSRCTDARFCVDSTNAHRKLATECFTIMNASWPENDLIGLVDPSSLIAEVADMGSRISAAFSEALIYSCMFWCDHLNQSHLVANGGENGADAVYLALETFATTHLLHWIEARSLLGSLDGLEMLLMSAADVCKGFPVYVAANRNGEEMFPTITDILGDACRFLAAFHHHIASRPLQVYVCAALFLPDGALLRTVAHTIGEAFRPVELIGRATAWSDVLMELNRTESINLVFKPTLDCQPTLAISPDASRLVTLGWFDKSSLGMHLWDAVSGVELMDVKIRRHPKHFTFSSLGDCVAVVHGPDKDAVLSVHVWDLVSNSSRWYEYDCPLCSNARPRSMAFSPDDRSLTILLSYGSKHCLAMIDVTREDYGIDLGNVTWLDLPDPPICGVPGSAARVNQVDRWILLGSHSAGGEFYTVGTTTKAHVYRHFRQHGDWRQEFITTYQHRSAVSALEFAVLPQGMHLCVGGRDGSVVVWSLEEETVIHDFKNHHCAVRSLAFSHAPAALLASASCHYDYTIIVRSLSNGGCIWRHSSGGSDLATLALVPPITPFNSRLFCAESNGRVRAYNLSDSPAPHSGGPVWLLQFSPDNRFLASCSKSMAYVRDTQTGKLQYSVGFHGRLDDISWQNCDAHGPVFVTFVNGVRALTVMRDPTGEWVSHPVQLHCPPPIQPSLYEKDVHVPSDLTWNATHSYLCYRAVNGAADDWRVLCVLPASRYPAQHPMLGVDEHMLHMSSNAELLAIGHDDGNVTILKLKDEIVRALAPDGSARYDSFSEYDSDDDESV